jgi:hypothetical protein
VERRATTYSGAARSQEGVRGRGRKLSSGRIRTRRGILRGNDEENTQDEADGRRGRWLKTRVIKSNRLRFILAIRIERRLEGYIY